MVNWIEIFWSVAPLCVDCLLNKMDVEWLKSCLIQWMGCYFCQWALLDLQQQIYYSFLYPPVGIKDWSIWMWASSSFFTCQKRLRDLELNFRALSSPLSDWTAFSLRYFQILFGWNLPISLMPIIEVALCWFMCASNTSLWWQHPFPSSLKTMLWFYHIISKKTDDCWMQSPCLRVWYRF